MLSGMLHIPVPAMELAKNPFAYIDRAERHVAWRRQCRELEKAQKVAELDARVQAALMWWLSPHGPAGIRRIEMGMCGLNPRGRGRGCGGQPY
jgi:hypothetical protein